MPNATQVKDLKIVDNLDHIIVHPQTPQAKKLIGTKLIIDMGYTKTRMSWYLLMETVLQQGLTRQVFIKYRGRNPSKDGHENDDYYPRKVVDNNKERSQ